MVAGPPPLAPPPALAPQAKAPVEILPDIVPLRPDRPRLVIARPAAPDPELTDPVEELDDYDEDDDEEDDELIPLSDISETAAKCDSTGIPALDHVLGGGLFVGSVVLLASPRGIGKSSLTLQMLDGLGHRCLYVTGEETRAQIAKTARRIGAASTKIYPLVERDLDKIFAKARRIRAQTIAIDSIQKMMCKDVNGRPGSPGQLKECTARLVDYAKNNDVALWIIGHVNSDDKVAGPTTIEHDVDVILELSQGPKYEGNERILRCADKNRYGPANHVGYFEMTADGLVPIDADGWDEKL